MKVQTADWTQLAETLETLRQELARLGERVTALEGTLRPAGSPTPPAPAHADGRAATPEGISEELVLVLAAAVAAYLGKKPHIRQIRLLGAGGWSQQGRVTIQASHRLENPAARRLS